MFIFTTLFFRRGSDSEYVFHFYWLWQQYTAQSNHQHTGNQQSVTGSLTSQHPDGTWLPACFLSVMKWDVEIKPMRQVRTLFITGLLFFVSVVPFQIYCTIDKVKHRLQQKEAIKYNSVLFICSIWETNKGLSYLINRLDQFKPNINNKIIAKIKTYSMLYIVVQPALLPVHYTTNEVITLHNILSVCHYISLCNIFSSHL